MVADIGTTWAKIIDEDGNKHVLSTKQILKERWHFRKATGHLSKNMCDFYTNELEALGLGALKITQDADFTVIDVGSRDTKFISFKNRAVHKLDWNQSCGASTGFTLELLMKYYELNPNEIQINPNDYYPITCAVFGIEKIFDSIIHEEKIEAAMGRFIMGIAANVYEFALKPKKLYVSGGLCENPAFVKALNSLTETIPLGRFVLAEGLKD